MGEGLIKRVIPGGPAIGDPSHTALVLTKCPVDGPPSLFYCPVLCLFWSRLSWQDRHPGAGDISFLIQHPSSVPPVSSLLPIDFFLPAREWSGISPAMIGFFLLEVFTQAGLSSSQTMLE